MQLKTIEVVTRKGKIALVNKERNWNNKDTTEYAIRIVNAPDMPKYIVGKVLEEWRVYRGGKRIGYANKLRSAIKIAASHAIDNIESIKPDINVYSYSRGVGVNSSPDNWTPKTVNENGMRIKKHRHTVFH